MPHGGIGSAARAQSAYGWNAEAGANHVAVVDPDDVRAAWNAGGGCRGVPAGPNPAGSNIDDVAFVALVVHEVSARSVELGFWHVFAAHPRAGGRLLWADVVVGGEQV